MVLGLSCTRCRQRVSSCVRCQKSVWARRPRARSGVRPPRGRALVYSRSSMAESSTTGAWAAAAAQLRVSQSDASSLPMTASARSSLTRLSWWERVREERSRGRPARRRACRAAERVDHGRRSASPSWCVGELPAGGHGGGISGAGGRGREGRASGSIGRRGRAHSAARTTHLMLPSRQRPYGARLPRVGARAASPPARPPLVRGR